MLKLTQYQESEVRDFCKNLPKELVDEVLACDKNWQKTYHKVLTPMLNTEDDPNKILPLQVLKSVMMLHPVIRT